MVALATAAASAPAAAPSAPSTPATVAALVVVVVALLLLLMGVAAIYVYVDEQPEQHVPRRPEGLYHLRQKRASQKSELSNKAASDNSELL